MRFEFRAVDFGKMSRIDINKMFILESNFFKKQMGLICYGKFTVFLHKNDFGLPRVWTKNVHFFVYQNEFAKNRKLDQSASPPHPPLRIWKLNLRKCFWNFGQKFKTAHGLKWFWGGGCGGEAVRPNSRNLDSKIKKFQKVLMHTFCPTPTCSIQKF